ncbi:trihelix transcription factor GTL1 [Rosa sericea]
MQGGAGGTQSHYGASASAPAAEGAAATTSMAAEAAAADQTHVVEEASPISSRPPAGGAISAVNLDELMTLSGAAADVAADQGGGGSGGGNRWPRQETLALLKIRSEMDVAFRDATLKGPLWEDVSRKLAELGYKRNAKKCKEKFENVHKYYKRTKEGRAGRQDGKSYKFFSELEALHGTAAASANVSASPPVHVTAAATNTPVSIGFGSISSPMPISSFRMTSGSGTTSTIPVMGPGAIPVMPSSQPPAATTATPMDINFSSNSSSSSHGEDDDYEDDDDVAGEPSTNTSRKRKRGTPWSRESGGSTRRMMEFFEILMKQVMQKQETMQQRFLEVIEKREQERNIREEAWKRQEMARLTREHELMTQERAISASRDAAIIAFLQKITGQTIQLPPPLNVHNAPPPPSVSSVHVTSVSAPPPQPSVQQFHQHQPHQQHSTPTAQVSRHQIQTPNPQTEVVMAVPEQQVAPPQENVVGSGGGFEATTSSSRWPKAEVLALIKLRSGLETRYQEAGPKGPLWEEISAGMQRMGYKRNPKRCKEKWENINKYFKKVKESNKARPEDAKTCPYFHELDALYRKRILGGGGSSSLGNQNIQQQPQQATVAAAATLPAPQTQGTVAATDQSGNKSGDHSPNLQKNLFGDAPEEAAKKKTL